MRSTSGTRRTSRVALTLVLFGAASLACTEFVHWGHISDRENSWGINGVEIAQKQDDGNWKVIGSSDGHGRWEVFKDRIKGGGTIRVSKKGYYSVEMTEAEFLQKHVILMQETGGSDYGESVPAEWME